MGLKLGGRLTYGITFFGVHPFFSQPRYFLGGGLGVHVPAGSWFVDVDATASMMFVGEKGLQHSFLSTTLRVVAVREIGGGVSLTAGIVWNVVIGWDGVDLDLAALPQNVERDRDVTIRQFPGFVLGLQL